LIVAVNLPRSDTPMRLGTAAQVVILVGVRVAAQGPTVGWAKRRIPMRWLSTGGGLANLRHANPRESAQCQLCTAGIVRGAPAFNEGTLPPVASDWGGLIHVLGYGANAALSITCHTRISCVRNVRGGTRERKHGALRPPLACWFAAFG
jgi:hypothetical protein